MSVEYMGKYYRFDCDSDGCNWRTEALAEDIEAAIKNKVENEGWDINEDRVLCYMCARRAS